MVPTQLLQGLAACPHLTHLSLQSLRAGANKHISSWLPAVRSLDLGGASSYECAQLLAKLGPQLTHLSWHNRVTVEAAADAIGACANLQSIELHSIGDTELPVLLRLQHLVRVSCDEWVVEADAGSSSARTCAWEQLVVRGGAPGQPNMLAGVPLGIRELVVQGSRADARL
uniref:Uncharacterized protein n=1 Tax=Chlamydomonas leiostraca TaxID=1034604 RepID=A0A7S0S016_9CHLO